MILKNKLIIFWKEQDAQDLVEYALVIAMVGLAVIGVVSALGEGIVSLWSDIDKRFREAWPGADPSARWVRRRFRRPRRSSLQAEWALLAWKH